VTFGDYTDDDAYDPAPADPEQVARKLHRFRRDGALEPVEWDDLSDDQRAVLVAVVARLLAWLRRSGAF
jgi:hypothetical protein